MIQIKNCQIPGQTGYFSVQIEDGNITGLARSEATAGAAPGLTANPERTGQLPQLSVTSQEEDQIWEAEGAFLVPGLWDEHVHVDLEAQEKTRLDVSGTTTPRAVLEKIKTYIAQVEAGAIPPQVPEYPKSIQASGFRPSIWTDPVLVSELDQISEGYTVLMVSGDAHSGWLNSAAQEQLGIEHHPGLIREQEWFNLLGQVTQLPDYRPRLETGFRRLIEEAVQKGIVGIRDMSFSRLDWGKWPSDLVNKIAVEVSVYPPDLPAVLAAGYQSGDPLLTEKSEAKITQGPLKIISDGSLGTKTAYCCRAYDDGAHGIQNFSVTELGELLKQAEAHKLSLAVHAIGDAALEKILALCEQLKAAGKEIAGSLEHVQLLGAGQAQRMAELGLQASIQPAHLLDDYPLAEKIWPQDLARCYAFQDLAQAGVELRLGSDAPVAPLDPWLAMAAAVYRGPIAAEDLARPLPDSLAQVDEGTPAETATLAPELDKGWTGEWNPSQRLTVRQALQASTRGQAVAVGAPADLLLLDRDPYLGTTGNYSGYRYAVNLLQTKVLATFRAGKVQYADF